MNTNTPFSSKERLAIASLDFPNFINLVRELEESRLARNNRYILAELGRRLDIPDDSLALLIFDHQKTHHTSHRMAHLYSVFSKDRIEPLKEMFPRRWNGTGYFLNLPNDDNIESLPKLCKLFNKVVVIRDNDFRIENGNAPAEWQYEPLYSLTLKPHTLNLGKVVEGFNQLRPCDHPERLAIHAEVDPVYRTLFQNGLPTDERMWSVKIPTRHEELLFRISVPAGRLRYFRYAVNEEAPIEVRFGDTQETRALIAVFKETQQRLAHPLIERDEHLVDQIKEFENVEQDGIGASNSQRPNPSPKKHKIDRTP